MLQTPTDPTGDEPATEPAAPEEDLARPAWATRRDAAISAAAPPRAAPTDAGGDTVSAETVDIQVDHGQLLSMLRRKSANMVGGLVYENAILEVALGNAKAEILELRAKVAALSD